MSRALVASPRMVLTLDLGTSATKAALWHGAELVGIARVPLTTVAPSPGRAEQDPESWWTSVVDACATLRAAHTREYAAVATIACSAARETFALFDAAFTPLGPGILWSDARAVTEADQLGDPSEFRAVTGVVVSPGCAAAKVAWVAAHEPSTFAAARWALAPRDLVVARLTGRVVTDFTLASRTGWYSLAGTLLCGDPLGSRLPELVASTTTLSLSADGATVLGLGPDVVVIPGAGDRACEVVGVGADITTPMVSWGSTANVSVPCRGPVAGLPVVAQVSRAPLDGFVVEAGLSAAGSAMEWLAHLTNTSNDALWSLAAAADPGANGVHAYAWFNGARAPWWNGDARAAFTGLTPAISTGRLARAIVESVAFDVARSVELIAPNATSVALAGGGGANETWRTILAAVLDRSLVVRAHSDAASVGARLLAAAATGESLNVETINPITARVAPDSALVTRYAEIRGPADAGARQVLDL